MDSVSNVRVMDSVSNPSGAPTPFPLYELHQVAHSVSDITAPSAMDILCEIVNSEYSDIGYNNMAPRPISASINRRHIDHEKESLLDILYSGGSKAMKTVNEDVVMLHEQQTSSTATFNNIQHYGCNPSHIIANMHQEFPTPDMHHFKLPLLEQEPESSINNSQLDEKFKTKEIRRNLERAILMHAGGNVAESALDPSCVKQGEEAKSKLEVHKDVCNVERIKGDKVKMKGKNNAEPYSLVDEAKFLKRKASGKEADSSSKKSSVPRIRHVTNKIDDKVSVENHRAHGDTSFANGGSKRIRVDDSLANDASRRGRIESLLANDGMKALIETSNEKAKAVGPRLTHISVERNRRKQMNEHLAILRSLMPTSYVQRSDQASIIGGVVEFIRELQQLLASLETQKRRRAYVAEALSPRVSAGSTAPSPRGSLNLTQLSPRGATQELVATSRSPLADVEVKLAGGAHVLLRTLSHKTTRGQLIHLIAALECMSLQILHLNITTLQQAILYTFTLKIGIECRLSVDDLADVGQQIFKDIHAKKL